MKKGINILFVSLVALTLSSSALEARTQQEGTPNSITKAKTQAAPVAVKKAPTNRCTNCSDNDNIKRCAETVNTVVYRDSCGSGCGFPVSVRVPSNCRGSM